MFITILRQQFLILRYVGDETHPFLLLWPASCSPVQMLWGGRCQALPLLPSAGARLPAAPSPNSPGRAEDAAEHQELRKRGTSGKDIVHSKVGVRLRARWFPLGSATICGWI